MGIMVICTSIASPGCRVPVFGFTMYDCGVVVFTLNAVFFSLIFLRDNITAAVRRGVQGNSITS